jgi:hypothetical protein
MKPFGSFFEEIIGQPVPNSVHEMLSTVETKLGRKLDVVTCKSNLVLSRDVIPVTHVNMEKVNAEIDKILGRIH